VVIPPAGPGLRPGPAVSCVPGVFHERATRLACQPQPVAESAVLRRPAVFHVPDLHRRVPPGFDPGAACRARGLSAADDLSVLPGPWHRASLAAAGLAARP